MDRYNRLQGTHSEPSAFCDGSGPLSILVMIGHVLYPGKWVVSCRLFKTKALRAKGPEAAKRETERIIRRYLKDALNELNREEEGNV